jgi:hypothetical protein
LVGLLVVWLISLLALRKTDLENVSSTTIVRAIHRETLRRPSWTTQRRRLTDDGSRALLIWVSF